MLFGAEHRELQRNVGRFIEAGINPQVEAWEEAQIFPTREIFTKLGRLGLLGLTKPVEFGGGADEIMLAVIAKTMGTLPKA